jgi:hypothetical protein
MNFEGVKFALEASAEAVRVAGSCMTPDQGNVESHVIILPSS